MLHRHEPDPSATSADPHGRRLLELLDHGPPAWTRDAACKEHPGIEFVPASTSAERATPEAVAGIGSACLVVDACRGLRRS